MMMWMIEEEDDEVEEDDVEEEDRVEMHGRFTRAMLYGNLQG